MKGPLCLRTEWQKLLCCIILRFVGDLGQLKLISASRKRLVGLAASLLLIVISLMIEDRGVGGRGT